MSPHPTIVVVFPQLPIVYTVGNSKLQAPNDLLVLILWLYQRRGNIKSGYATNGIHAIIRSPSLSAR